MGAIISYLTSKDANEAFIDFENAVPTVDEGDVYNMVSNILAQGPEILARLENYSGAAESIRKALSTPTPDNEKEAFEAVLQRVEIIKSFFDFSKEIENCVPRLLSKLADSDSDEKLNLSTQQALAKQLADVFDFVLRFDELKMRCPALQNDFAYYRRSMSKHKNSSLAVREEEASVISLFLAAHIPMMTALSKSTAHAVRQNENVKMVLAVMANTCFSMVKTRKFSNEETNLFCLRAMTGSIVLFDHVNPMGAFHKRSPIWITKCVVLLTRDSAGNPAVEPLINALKYSTLHLNDPTTPASLAELLCE